MANAIPFSNLSQEERLRLQNKYGGLGGKMILTSEGVKPCYGGSCGCIPEPRGGGRRGPVCPSSLSHQLKNSIFRFQDGMLTSVWALGDPIVINFQNGTILSVEY